MKIRGTSCVGPVGCWIRHSCAIKSHACFCLCESLFLLHTWHMIRLKTAPLLLLLRETEAEAATEASSAKWSKVAECVGSQQLHTLLLSSIILSERRRRRRDVCARWRRAIPHIPYIRFLFKLGNRKIRFICDCSPSPMPKPKPKPTEE